MAEKGESGKPIIRVELFHATVSVLNRATLSFNLLGGLTLEKAKKIAESMNKNVLDISVSMSDDVCENGGG